MIIPVRKEPRGEFPDHGDEPPRPVRSAEEAKRYARERLERWREEFGYGVRD